MKDKDLSEIEERHGVDLDQGYKSDKACASFADYIADEYQQIVVGTLTEGKFLSLQADGTILMLAVGANVTPGWACSVHKFPLHKWLDLLHGRIY